MTAAVSLTGITRHYDAIRAVDGVTLDIGAGEFFALLGPSGSGKTTTLRLIAGFERPTSGTVRLFGDDVTGTPPWQRPVNTVFQDYALFPHLDVRDNVAYGLMIAGRGKADRRDAAEAALAMVALPGYGDRKPGALSGGQRQRVALARALVMEPKVLLLDEPLGALDLKLREAMQDELKTLQRRLGITFVFVTHDQGEALSMADRVAVFNEGRIVQVGTPQDVYYRPNVPFVADFVGSSNVLPPALTGRTRSAAVRPEAVRLGQGEIRATVTAVSFLGAATRVALDAQGTRLTALLPRDTPRPVEGETVMLGWGPGRPARDDRVSGGLFWRRPGLLVLALLLPPLLWLGIIYLGSLVALLVQSFFSIDEFSGMIVREWTLKTYGELLRPAHLDIIWRTVLMAALVTLASAVIAFPIAYYAARYARGRWKVLFYLGVMLPLWSSYLVKVYAWKLILAKEGILGLAVRQAPPDCRAGGLARPAGDRGAVAVGLSHRNLHRLRLRLAALHDLAGTGRSRAGARDAARGERGSRRRTGRHLPPCASATGAARHRCRVDLHLLAHARRLHHPADRRHLGSVHRPRGLTSIKARPGTSRWRRPLPSCRSSSWGST